MSAFDPLRTFKTTATTAWKVVQTMFYESTSLHVLTLLAHIALFVVASVLLFCRGWPLTAGLVMLASTLLPVAAQTWFKHSEMPGLPSC